MQCHWCGRSNLSLACLIGEYQRDKPVREWTALQVVHHTYGIRSINYFAREFSYKAGNAPTYLSPSFESVGY